jgi:ABC-type transporter Mla subunit MlaD
MCALRGNRFAFGVFGPLMNSSLHDFASRDDNVRGVLLSLMPKLDSLSNALLTMFDLLLDALRFITVSLRPQRRLQVSP